MSAQVLVHNILLNETQIEHHLVVLTQLLELLQLLVVRSESHFFLTESAGAFYYLLLHGYF